MFDEINNGSPQTGRASFTINDLPLRTALRTSPQPPLSHSDLVLWWRSAEEG
jgi:hypothetical protein